MNTRPVNTASMVVYCFVIFIVLFLGESHAPTLISATLLDCPKRWESLVYMALYFHMAGGVGCVVDEVPQPWRISRRLRTGAQVVWSGLGCWFFGT